MANKSRNSSAGLLALVTGVAAGAAAVFLSKKENREMAKKELLKAEKKVKAVTAEARKNPKKFADKVEKKGAVLAKKVIKEVKKDSKVVAKKAAVAEKKVVKAVKAAKPAEKAAVKSAAAAVEKVTTSPALKVVGKKVKK